MASSPAIALKSPDTDQKKQPAHVSTINARPANMNFVIPGVMEPRSLMRLLLVANIFSRMMTTRRGEKAQRVSGFLFSGCGFAFADAGGTFFAGCLFYGRAFDDFSAPGHFVFFKCELGR